MGCFIVRRQYRFISCGPCGTGNTVRFVIKGFIVSRIHNGLEQLTNRQACSKLPFLHEGKLSRLLYFVYVYIVYH